MSDLDKMDAKHKAQLSLAIAAEMFLVAANEALEAKYPGRAAENRALLDAGKAHVVISIQMGSAQIRSALGIVEPVFVDVLPDAEMTLQSSIAAAFGSADEVRITDLRTMN